MRTLGLVMAAATASMLASGCGSSDGGSSGTGGTTGGGGTGGGGAGAETFGFDFALYEVDATAPDMKGAPIADALVALDVPSSARQDLATGSEGKVHIEVPADAADFTWTAAKSGELPVRTFYRATIAEVQAQVAAEGEVFALMAPPPEITTPPATVTLTVNATVPFCASITWNENCTDGAAISWTIPQSSQPYSVVTYSTDEHGCPLELREITLPDTLTDQTVGLVFDGSNPAVPESFDVRLQLPADPASLLNTEGPNVALRFPFHVFDSSYRVWGGACNERLDAGAGTLDLTLAYFSKGNDERIFWSIVFPGHGSDMTSAGSEHWLGLNKPGPGPYEVRDIPVLSSPTGAAERASTFASQPIEGATRYWVQVNRGLHYWDAGSTPVWTAASWRHQDIVLPALPAGYDSTEQWGPGQGFYRLFAGGKECDYLTGSFMRVPSTMPEWNYAYSPPLSGPILE
jgi:hypothetical protein